MDRKKILILFLLIVGVVAYRYYDLGQYLSLEALQNNLEKLRSGIEALGFIAILLYFAAYVICVSFFLPVALWFTLLAGALFPLWQGILLVSFASSCGAVINAFLARYLLRSGLETRYRKQLDTINRNLERSGSSYLFSLRLLPIFPFFVLNLVFGLTRMSLGRFYWISQLGMLPGTLVYVNAGSSLQEIHSLGDIASPRVLGSFILLGVFPYIIKLLQRLYRKVQMDRRWPRPRRGTSKTSGRYDANVVVIGAGAGGLVSAYIAGMLKAKVILIEKSKMGGDCLNYGCVPSKSLLTAGKYAWAGTVAKAMGIHYAKPQIDFAAVMKNVRSKIDSIAPKDSVERYQSLGVEVLEGEGRMLSPYQVEVRLNNGERTTVSCRSIVLATGAQPNVPNIPGLRDLKPLTSETVWDLNEPPKRLLVMGGGPIGCELALAFSRLGIHVIQVERGNQVLSREEPEAAQIAHQALADSGVELLFGWEATRFERGEDGQICAVLHQKQADSGQEAEKKVYCDQVLCALGRVAPKDNCGLAELGIERDERGAIVVDQHLQTSLPNIYAVGDAALRQQFTHAAGHSAYYAVVNALFGHWKKSAMSLEALPSVCYLEPEIARVGLTEKEARKLHGEDVEICHYEMDDNDRAIAEGHTEGFVRLVLDGKGKVLGVTIVAPHAGEMLGEWTMVLGRKIKKEAIFGTIYSYPTYSEASKAAIAQYKKAHMPHKALKFLEKYFRRQRK
ncbi:FAD-dependent oxidoreductase [Candidatus Haliotispira prima]|uniref:FAD-dependent oxidoreductase n=1 Tax=Candidatus Haliotispira prima TaxID=3034016 RepID=A0ABY8MGJ8_9SPIO|nr:FAD-dependent oxidoreductase [Candidatus Haliotispira prima]